MPNNMNFLNNLFLKKKINNLNIKSLNFYKLTKVLFLRNKYNYYFLIRHKLKKFVMFYNKLYFNYSSKLLYSNNLKKLFYFNLFTKKLRFGSIFFLRRKITTFSNFKFFKSLQKLNKIKRIRLNIVLKKNIQSKRKSLFRNFVKFFNKKKLFCNRLIIKHKLFFNPKLRRSLKVRFLRTKSSQYSQVLKKNLLGNINKRPSSGTKIFFLLNLDKFLALKSSNSFFRLKNNISVFNLNRYFSLYNLKQLNGKKKINLKKNKSIYDKLKSKST